MVRALLPSPGLPPDGSFPRLALHWSGLRIDAAHLAAFRAAVGVGDGAADQVGVLYPHVLGFRLQMALLTQRAFPLPIWNALQVRNHLVRHRCLESGQKFDLQTRVAAHRRVPKGLEVDLESRLTHGSELFWQSLVSYFYRGRFGAAEDVTPAPAQPDLGGAVARYRFPMPGGGGWGFGGLTGDYNGIHCWPWYARRFGFRSAFAHPQRVAGLCLARLRGPQSEAQTLDLWIKGPVFYGARVTLSARVHDDVLAFGLALEDDLRHALVGSWRSGVPA